MINKLWGKVYAIFIEFYINGNRFPTIKGNYSSKFIILESK